MKENDLALTMYLQQLASMNRNKNRKGQMAPHKPILMLAIIDLVESGTIKSDTIQLSDKLCRQFKLLWDHYVPNGIQFSPDITKPFYHLSYEPFWHLVPAAEELYQVAEPTPQLPAPKPQYTLAYMRRTYQCAHIDHTLLLLMQDHDSRVALRGVLLTMLSNPQIDSRFLGNMSPLQVAVKGNLNVHGDVLLGKSKKNTTKSVA